MKIWRIILLSVVSIFCGCSEEPENITPEGENDNNKPITTLVLDTTSVSFTEEGGTKSVSIFSSESWTASVINNRAESWCTIEYSGVSGECELLINASPNETPNERSASIIVKAGSVEKIVIVTQKQKDALTVTSTKFEIGAEGGQITVEVKANVAFEYAIEEFAKDWLYIDDNTRSMSSSTLVFTVLPNEEFTKREGVIVIKSGDLKETIVVYQSGVAPSIIISQNKYTVSSKGGNISVEVSSNIDIEVQIPEGVSWVYENKTRSMSTNSYVFFVEENVSEEKRECLIQFSNVENNLMETVIISQDGYPSIVYDSNGADKPLIYDLSINNSVLFYILAGSDYKIESDSSWCRLIKLEIVREDIPYTIELDPNTTGESRTAYITVYNNKTEISEIITVIQPSQNEVIYEDGKEYYYVEADESVLTIPIITNMQVSDIKVVIYEGWETPEWINLNSTTTRAFREDSLVFHVAKNDGEQRSARIEIYKSDREYDYDCYTIIVTQYSYKETENRNILRNFYDKMGGDNWLRQDNWFSEDKTISEWYGVSEIGEYNELMVEFSEENNLIGEITDESINGIHHINIQNNKNIKNAHITNNESVQTLSLINTSTQSVNIENCPNLRSLSLPASVEDVYVMNCGLSDYDFSYAQDTNKQAMMLKSLTISNCSKLRGLNIDGIDGDAPNLQTVDISGCEVLERFLFTGGNLSSLKVDGCIGLEEIYVPSNKLTSIDLSSCKGLKSLTINDNTELTELDLSGLSLLEYLRIGGNVVDIFDYPSDNLRPSKLRTLKVNGCMALQDISGTDYTKDPHGSYYYEHLPCELETLELNDCTSLKSLNLAFTNIKSVDLSGCTSLESIDIDNETEIVLDLSGCPNIKHINSPGYHCKDGTAVLMSDEYDWSKIESTYVSCPITTKDAYYHISTDFSKNGSVRIVQTATEGNGINVVLMGDGFNDKMISDGTYDAYMDKMIDGLFSYEPYKSFKHLFNIYVVTAVSEQGYVYGANTGKTALGINSSDNMFAMDMDDSIKEYTTKALDEELLEKTVVIVGINGFGRSNCRLYEPQVDNDYGCGFSIALCQAPGNGLAALVAHEAGGHGFAKLADEYIDDMTSAPTWYFDEEKYGWYKNIDDTHNLSLIKWTDFINDSRYAIENLGAYEGALYKSGIYRATEQSMMNNQNETPYFNAPSRNAIYYRIHKLAYGEDWVYDYETFVEYDATNLTRSRSLPNSKSTNGMLLKNRTAPPQIIRR